MKTTELIDMLSRDAGPSPKAVALRRFGPVAVLGAVASTAIAIALFGPIPPSMFATSVPWMKLVYTGLLALFAGWLAAQLARPIARLTLPAAGAVTVVLAMLALGGLALLSTAPGERLAELLGGSWQACPWNVLLLSVPGLVGALVAARGLAPTRPIAAGFAAGIFGGALGAFGYALHCPEASAAFVATWYTLGIALSGLVGAALGPVVLRW